MSFFDPFSGISQISTYFFLKAGLTGPNVLNISSYISHRHLTLNNSNSKCILNAFYVPELILNSFHVSSYLILPMTIFSSVQFSRSVMSDSCDPMNRSMPGLPVYHQLLEITHTYVHWVGDTTQPSHPLSSPSPPALNPSQNQGLLQWVNSSHQVAKVLEFQLQHWSFQWTPRTDLLQDGLVGSPCSPRDSQESSPTPLFKSINSSALSFLHSPTLTSIHDHWKNHSLD